MRKTAVALIGFLALAAAGLAAQAPANRFALVIGNGDYAELGQLANPKNDAVDMAAALRGLGFVTELLVDADLAAMENAVVQLGNRLSAAAGSIGFFYYAGHGVQASGTNYLIPADARIQNETFLKTKALPAQAVMDILQAAKNSLNIVVLDACRDNPFGWSRGGNRGLTVVGTQPAGSIVVYATSAGSVAQDGAGRNGVFTQELLKNLSTPGLEIKEIFNRTGAGVRTATGGAQIPAVYSQAFDQVYLIAGAAVPVPDPAAVRTADLMVKTAEPGAEIVLDGVVKGFSPLLLSGLPAGRPVRIAVRTPTQAGALELTLQPGELREATIDLFVQTGNLVIVSKENAVRVLLDGTDLGPLGAGLFRDIPAGPHALELVGADLYYSAAVQVSAAAAVQVNAAPYAVGALDIQAPAGTTTTVAGAGGTWTVSGPDRLNRLPAGTYRLSNQGSGFMGAEGNLAIGRGEDVSYVPYRSGRLSILGAIDAACAIDGKACDPAGPIDLAPGRYTVTVQKAGYRGAELSCDIELGKSTPLSVGLELLRPASLVLNGAGHDVSLAVDGDMAPGTPLRQAAAADGRLTFAGLPSGVPLQLTLTTANAAAPFVLSGIVLEEDQTLALDLPSYRAWLASALAAERTDARTRLAGRRGRAAAGIVSLAAGILGVAGAGAVYYLGTQAGAAYDAAVSSAAAAAARAHVELYGKLFGAAAGLGAAGLAAGPLLLAIGPDPAVLERSLADLDARIAELGN